MEVDLKQREDGRYDLTINGKRIGTLNSLEEFAERLDEYGRKTLRDIENGQISEV